MSKNLYAALALVLATHVTVAVAGGKHDPETAPTAKTGPTSEQCAQHRRMPMGAMSAPQHRKHMQMLAACDAMDKRSNSAKAESSHGHSDHHGGH